MEEGDRGEQRGPVGKNRRRKKQGDEKKKKALLLREIRGMEEGIDRGPD